MTRIMTQIMLSVAAALVFCRDSGTEILVRDYDAPQIETFTEVRPVTWIDSMTRIDSHDSD